MALDADYISSYNIEIFLLVSHLYQASPCPPLPLPPRPLPHTPVCGLGCFATAVAENQRSSGQKKTGGSLMATKKIHSAERFVNDFIFLNFNSIFFPGKLYRCRMQTKEAKPLTAPFPRLIQPFRPAI